MPQPLPTASEPTLLPLLLPLENCHRRHILPTPLFKVT